MPNVAVITGASRGLGAGIAASFAERGIAVGLCARTQPTAPSGASAVCTSVDVTDADAVETFAQQVTATLGPIDVWVNNAGVLDPIGPVRAAPADQVRQHIEINVLGVMWGSQTFARLVHDRDSPGTLVNISSGAAQSVYEGWAAYGAAKAAVDHFSRILAAEESPHGLRVLSLAPGVVDTDMQALIRSTPIDRFPNVDRFHALKQSDAFNSPAWIAEQILAAADGHHVPSWIRHSSDPVVVRVPDEPGR